MNGLFMLKMKEKTTKYEAKKIWNTKRMIQENSNEKPNKTENNKPKNTKRIPPIFILFGVHLRCFWSMWRIKRKALPEWCAMWLIFPSYFACIHILSIVSSVLGVLCFVLCALCLVPCVVFDVHLSCSHNFPSEHYICCFRAERLFKQFSRDFTNVVLR